MHQDFFATFLHTAESDPARTCFELFSSPDIDGGRPIGFGEMRLRISAAAGLLRDLGVVRGDIVLIFAQHSVGKLAAFFGAQWLGAIPSFMPPPTIKQDVAAWAGSHRQIVDRVQPRVVISEPGSLTHMAALDVAQVISTDAIEQAQPAAELTAPLPASPDEVAFLQHSSGTTGLKKGVMVTWRQLVSQTDIYGEQIGLDKGATIVSWLPIYHDMGLIAATLLPMRRGVTVRLIDTFTWLSAPGMLMELLARSPRSYCWLPNFAFNYLARRARVRLDQDALAGVQAIINCSEPCKMSDMSAFSDRFSSFGLRPAAMQVCYAAAEYVFAMTQTAAGAPIAPIYVNARVLEDEHRASCCAEDDPAARSIMPVGRALPDARIHIGDNLPDGQVGEIRITGPSLCSGYFRNEEETAAKFHDGWYHTGDLGFRFGDTFFITGRTDDLIIVRGKNIYAHDVEAIVSVVNGVKPGRIVAFGMDDASGTQSLAVAVEAVAGAKVDNIQAAINQRMQDEFGIVPADVCVVGENTLIKTTSGKISRSENRKRYFAGTLGEYR